MSRIERARTCIEYFRGTGVALIVSGNQTLQATRGDSSQSEGPRRTKRRRTKMRETRGDEEKGAMHAGTTGERRHRESLSYMFLHPRKIPG